MTKHIVVTEKMLNRIKNKLGVHSNAQKKYATSDGRFKSLEDMVNRSVTTKFWEQLRVLGYSKPHAPPGRGRAKKAKPINSMTTSNHEWDWKPKKENIPKLKTVSAKGNKNSGRKKQKRARVSRLDNDDFYMSREWRSLRVRALEKYECKCMMCGRSPKEHSIVVHVDHIKPRSKHPELSLDFENLQLLCEDCNLGKSNKYETDWRPK